MALQETLERIPLYESNGADGIFVPCIVNESDIAAVVQQTSLPINVMCMPTLPGYATLQSLGVKRISMGPFLFNKTYGTVEALAKSIIATGETICLF
jgi:2-methylisocitrate lyase-like PEP mutase family enzyme